MAGEIKIGETYTYPKAEKDPPLKVTVSEIRTSMSGEKIFYVERQDGSGQKFTCPAEDLT